MSEQQTVQTDIAIVGGTASGVAAAIVAARMGARVILTERTQRLGGMIGNGVSKSDVSRWGAATYGIFEEFRDRMRAHYAGDPKSDDGLKYEPGVAARAIAAMVAAMPGIDLRLGTRAVGVLKAPGNRVTGVVVEDEAGTRTAIRARVTIDATDEADVAVWAGAQYRVGREARSVEEPHAGEIYLDRGGYNSASTTILHRYKVLPESTGRADERIQGYGYLMTVKDYGPGPDDRPHVLREPPPGYDPATFAHTTPWEHSWAIFSGVIPNGKHEVNQYPYGVEMPGENTGYPDGTEEERAAIIERHKNRALGYIYHLQHVEGKTHLGLADDEYEENDNFPVQLYIRQGRRVLGDYILNESDINPHLKGDGVRPPQFADAVAVGYYAVDIHPVRPMTNPDNPHLGEGELLLPKVTAPFQIPYRCLVPQGVEGLLVGQAISTTHIAFSSIRLEPTRMATGMATAVAACLALRDRVPLRAVNVPEMQRLLIAAANTLYLYQDVTPRTPCYAAVQALSVVGGFPGLGDYFEPDAPLTRAQLAEALVRSFGIIVSTTASHFADVPPAHPAFRYVETLYDWDLLAPFALEEVYTNGPTGVINESRFAPDDPATEGQLVALLALCAGDAPPAASSDASITRGRAAEMVAAAVAPFTPVVAVTTTTTAPAPVLIPA